VLLQLTRTSELNMQRVYLVSKYAYSALPYPPPSSALLADLLPLISLPLSLPSHPSRTGDIALGLVTGVLAYALYEKKQGPNRPHEDKLLSLIQWKRERWAGSKEVKAVEQEGWEEIEREFKLKQEEKR
jgi:hypothetical protein